MQSWTSPQNQTTKAVNYALSDQSTLMGLISVQTLTQSIQNPHGNNSIYLDTGYC